MSLDLTALSKQVRQMSATLASRTQSTNERLTYLRQTYLRQAGQEAYWEHEINQQRAANPWRLLARPFSETLTTIREAPPAPTAYQIIATDGSQIDVDRHGMASFFLINIGRVYLRYGEHPIARLSSQPMLSYREDELYIQDGPRKIAIEGNYLSALRDIHEMTVLTDLCQELCNDTTHMLALLDGTLMRWALAGFEKSVKNDFLQKYLEGLEYLREQNIPVASYISRPRATEVVNTIALMDGYSNGNGSIPTNQTDANQPDDQTDMQPDDHPWVPTSINGMVDGDIFFDMLAEGQRGPLFASMSRINVESYGDHLVHFFYMRVGREMVRVEIPLWIAEDSDKVDLVHSLVYDQCMRGQGYPVALARAHEQAVVRSADRRAFWRMVEGSLVRAEVSTTSSSKQENKEYSKI